MVIPWKENWFWFLALAFESQLQVFHFHHIILACRVGQRAANLFWAMIGTSLCYYKSTFSFLSGHIFVTGSVPSILSLF